MNKFVCTQGNIFDKPWPGLEKLQDFLTKLLTSLPCNKFRQSQIFDGLRGSTTIFSEAKSILKCSISYTNLAFLKIYW